MTTQIKCHACGSDKVFNQDTRYVADHYPPKELNTSYARDLLALARIRCPQAIFRPHCPTCSSHQADFGALAARLQQIAKDAGIPVYK